MADELTSTKTYDLTGDVKPAAGTHPEEGASDPTLNHPGDEPAARTDEELEAHRKHSNISFISHIVDDIEGLIKVPDGIPSNLRVGRDGETPEVRADLHNVDGPRSEMQVDVHAAAADVPTKDVGFGPEAKPASTTAGYRPAEAASDAPDDGAGVPEAEAALQVKSADEVLSSAKDRKDTSEFEGNLDPDAPVTGVVDEAGNVHATNAAPEPGQLVTGDSITPEGEQADNAAVGDDAKPQEAVPVAEEEKA